jgi:hypothetical protein
MVVPNYTYLKLKMSRPNGIITVSTSVQRAYECEVECCELASAIIASEGLPAVHQMVDEEAPNAKKSSRSFGLAEDTKEVLIDPSSFDDRVVHIGTAHSAK